jgi:hypothetical protein
MPSSTVTILVANLVAGINAAVAITNATNDCGVAVLALVGCG